MSGQGLRIVPYAGHKGYQCYLDGWKVNGKRKRFLVSAAIEGYLNGKVRAGLSQHHLRDICGRIGRYNEAFGARAHKNGAGRDIEDWLHGISLVPQSVVSYRALSFALELETITE